MIELEQLKQQALQLRRSVLKMTHHVGSGHVGGSLSQADILTALYFSLLNINPRQPQWRERDRLVLSKGHASPGYYAALALRGFFPEEELLSFHQLGSRLQGHPDMHKTPGVDFSTGSLGQGLSAALGFALARAAAKLSFTSYALLGDGELQEGQIWEAAMYAGSKQINHLVAILDNNEVQLAESTRNTLALGEVEKKWQAFGWSTLSCNGHDMGELLTTLTKARTLSRGGPVMVNAHTVKGRGVKFMEGDYRWHGKAPDNQQYQQALAQLEECYPCDR